MISPEEEAIGRLQGLRHVIASGNKNALGALAGELGALAHDRVDNARLRESISRVVRQVDDAVSANGSDDLLGSAAARIDETLAAFAALLGDDESDEELGLRAAAAPAENVDAAAGGIDPNMLAVFVTEAAEHLEIAEQRLLELEQDGSNADALDAVFRGFHSVKGNAGFVGLRQLGKLAHEAETLFELIRSGDAQLTDSAAELALLTVDALRNMVEVLGAAAEPRDEMSAEGASLTAQLANLIRSIQAGEAPPPRPSAARRVATQAADVELAPPHAPLPVAAAKVEHAGSRPAAKKASGGIVRVDQERLDALINLIGELVIAESIVSSTCHTPGDGEREQSLLHLRKITHELQELSLSLRMAPIRDLFQKQVRLVRDLGRQLGKRVELAIEGGATELDKNVIDQLADPLVHIVRNAIDHGIEPAAAEREAAGKPGVATITLSAGYQGGHIRVSIRDDGRGLNRDKILAKAVARGVVPPSAQLTGEQIDQLIFKAGLSTAEKITDVSGRGVGMDVVGRNIEALRGVVEVSSEPGVGTEIVITLPMTLAIIDGLVVTAGGHRFVIPSHEIDRLVETENQQVENLAGRQPVLTVRGRHLPVFPLDVLAGFRRDPTVEPGSVIVVAKAGSNSFGLFVDQVLNRQQVVIKQLGEAIGVIDGVTGGAVMADGQVALIVDLAGLHQRIIKRRAAG